MTRTLNLDNTELNFLDAAGIVQIGDTSSNSTITIDNVDTTSSTFDLGIIGGQITVNNGLSSGGDVFLQSLTAEDIILNSIVRATGSGDTIVIATGDEVINNFGVGALDPDLGRFLIFAQSPDKITANGLTAAERFGQSFSSLASVSIPGVNNNFVYAIMIDSPVADIREPDPYKAEEDVKEIIDKKFIQDSKEGENAVGCLANYGDQDGTCIIAGSN